LSFRHVAQGPFQSRFRIDGVNVDHLQAQTIQEGPISWITSGKIDAVLDIKFPREETEDALDVLLGGIADAISPQVLTDLIPGQRELAKPPLVAPESEAEEKNDEEQKVVVDIDLRFKDLKAAVPVFTSDLSYASNALIRPIVAFMKYSSLSC
jgi:mitochondrial distribution and morphology protein 31